MLAEICVRIFSLFIGDMVSLVCFILFRIFEDFRKVFDAVLQLVDGLLCFLSEWLDAATHKAVFAEWTEGDEFESVFPKSLALLSHSLSPASGAEILHKQRMILWRR